MNQLSKPNTSAAAVEKVLLKGDLGRLTEVERVQYYAAVCRSIGLNPLTKPFDYLEEKGKLSLYLNSVGFAQVRNLHGISCKVTNRQFDKEFFYCTAVASDGRRTEDSTAILALTDKYGKPITGQAKANLMMKGETKAKRRATLALVGIPWGDTGQVKSAQAIDPPPDVLIGTDW